MSKTATGNPVAKWTDCIDGRQDGRRAKTKPESRGLINYRKKTLMPAEGI